MEKGKIRTISDLHDKHIGNRKFAKICDLLIAGNYKIDYIREYYEKFKFVIDGFEFEYRKDWKTSSKYIAEKLMCLVNHNKRYYWWRNYEEE